MGLIHAQLFANGSRLRVLLLLPLAGAVMDLGEKTAGPQTRMSTAQKTNLNEGS